MATILACKDLRKPHGGTVALNNLDLTVESVCIVCPFGANGSG